MAKGWVKIDRSLADHWLYNDKPFNKSMAWIDLIILADHKTHITMWRGNPTEFKRGDVNISISELAERWGWDRRKVKRFLKCLEDGSMVVLKVTRKRTIIKLVNYGIYQDKRTTNGTTDGTRDGTSDGTTDGTYLRIIKNNKEQKEEPSADSLISPFGGRYEE